MLQYTERRTGINPGGLHACAGRVNASGYAHYFAPRTQKNFDELRLQQSPNERCQLMRFNQTD
jgi:hypothetical protein